MDQGKLHHHLKSKPYETFAEFKARVGSNTKHTEQTYAAFQFYPDQIPRDSHHVGAVFVVTGAIRREVPFDRGTRLRVTSVTDNWVYAVPATYVEKFWE